MSVETKIRRFCANRERSPDEVRKKLLRWGVEESEAENMISQLLKENFLNELRFATQFTEQKFKDRKWGVVKMEAALRAHNITDDIIRSALADIDAEEYRQTLLHHIRQKSRTTHAREKIIRYCLQKGFEEEMVEELVNGYV